MRRLGRLRVLLGKLVQNRLGLTLAPEDAQASTPFQLGLWHGIARRILHRDRLEELQRAVAVPANLAHEPGEVERVVGRAVLGVGGGERQQVGLGLGSVLSPQIASLSQVASAGLQVLFLKFSRDDENQADKLGFAYMANDGYDPRQMVDVFKTLERVSKLEPYTKDSHIVILNDGTRLPVSRTGYGRLRALLDQQI